MKAITGKDRVFAALGGQTLDRRPYTAMLSLYGARLTRCPLSHYYASADAYAEGQGAVLETFQPDVLFSSFVLVAIAEAFGSKVRYFENQAPNLGRPAARNAAEFMNLTVPDVDSHERLLYLRQSLQKMSNLYGDNTAILGILLSPVDLPILIMGVEGWLETVLFDPEGARAVLDVITPFFLRFANAMLKDGAHALALPLAFLTPAIVTRDMAASFTLPVLQDAFQAVDGPIFLHHVGGTFLKFLDLFCGLPGVAGFVMDPRDDLERARKIMGPEKLLICGPQGPTLHKRSAGGIKKNCLKMMATLAPNDRFMLATTGADVDFRTSQDRILALKSSVETGS